LALAKFSLGFTHGFLVHTTKNDQIEGGIAMGAIERNGYRFIPEFSVIQQNGAVHVYNHDQFLEEIKFSFSGKFPELDQIEELVNQYCEKNHI
jgi:hypothetical protein